MKKLHSLFILSILALTMFVGCQMPTDGTGNGTGTEATEYTITVVAPHGTVELDKTKAKAGETVKLTKLEADNGYRLETMSIKKENGEDVTEVDRKNQSFTMPESNVTVTVNFKETTPTYTVSVPEGNINGSSGNSSYKLVIQNSPIDGYKKGDQVEILITNGNFDVNTGYGTPEGLYLVNVRIEDSNGNDIKSTVGLKIEDNKIKFTMPSNTVNVYASFEDVVCRPFDYNSKNDTAHWENQFNVYYSGEEPFEVALRFDTKEYDNLESFGGEFIYRFHDLESARVGSNTWYFYIQLGKDDNVYDYESPENCKYHENPVVIYNGKMCEPTIDNVLGYRFVDLDSKN